MATHSGARNYEQFQQRSGLYRANGPVAQRVLLLQRCHTIPARLASRWSALRPAQLVLGTAPPRPADIGELLLLLVVVVVRGCIISRAGFAELPRVCSWPRGRHEGASRRRTLAAITNKQRARARGNERVLELVRVGKSEQHSRTHFAAAVCVSGSGLRRALPFLAYTLPRRRCSGVCIARAWRHARVMRSSHRVPPLRSPPSTLILRVNPAARRLRATRWLSRGSSYKWPQV